VAANNDQKMWGKYSANEVWKIWLMEGNSGFARLAPVLQRTVYAFMSTMLKLVPSNPRCLSCEAPFKGIGAPLMKAIGKEQSHYNPSLCADCENTARKFGSRAEIPLTMLFADIRGSTSLAEELGAEEFGELINRFYTVTSAILVQAMAFIDKLIGDEASAFFVPGFAGERHASVALEAAMEILRQTGHGSSEGPWVPVGVGIHSGPAVVGAVGQADGISDITVIGDTANTASRLASLAKAGEIVFSDETAVQAKMDTDLLTNHLYELKGKSQPVSAWILSFDSSEQPA
jgi:adenylate cyclase